MWLQDADWLVHVESWHWQYSVLKMDIGFHLLGKKSMTEIRQLIRVYL